MEKNNKQKYILTCQNCNQEYILYLYPKHYNDGSYRKTCSSKCAHELTTKHTNLKTKNLHISESIKNKYINKIPNKRYCAYCNREINIERRKSKYCSDECKKLGTHINISNAIKGKTGGLRVNSYKNYKSGYYNNIHCDSSWELAFLIYHLEHNKYIERCKEVRKYIFENKEYSYYPDFITDEGIIEIKGYKSERWNAKYKYNPDIIVLYKEDMKKYLDYVEEKYGKNFTQLYDKGSH